MNKERRKLLIEQSKLIKTYMGVIQITNMVNGKLFITAYPNLKNQWINIQAQLDLGRYINAELQRDWKEYGRDAFCYVVLEEKSTDEIIDVKWELKQMKKSWLEKIQPYGDKGYNKVTLS